MCLRDDDRQRKRIRACPADGPFIGSKPLSKSLQDAVLSMRDV